MVAFNSESTRSQMDLEIARYNSISFCVVGVAPFQGKFGEAVVSIECDKSVTYWYSQVMV